MALENGLSDLDYIASSNVDKFFQNGNFKEILDGDINLKGDSQYDLFHGIIDSHRLESLSNEHKRIKDDFAKKQKALNMQYFDEVEDTKMKKLIDDTSKSIQKYNEEEQKNRELKEASMVLYPVVKGKHYIKGIWGTISGVKKNKRTVDEFIADVKSQYQLRTDGLRDLLQMADSTSAMQSEVARNSAIAARTYDKLISQATVFADNTKKSLAEDQKKLEEILNVIAKVREENVTNGKSIEDIPEDLIQRKELAQAEVYKKEFSLRKLQDVISYSIRKLDSYSQMAVLAQNEYESNEASKMSVANQLESIQNEGRLQIDLWENQVQKEAALKFQNSTNEYLIALADATIISSKRSVQLEQERQASDKIRQETTQRAYASISDNSKKLKELYEKDRENREQSNKLALERARARMEGKTFNTALISNQDKAE